MMKKLLLLSSVLLLVLFSTNLKAQYTITIDSVVATNPISCFGDFADIDVYVDNDTCPVPPLGCVSSFVPYQLKVFKPGAFATVPYLSSSVTTGNQVTANNLGEGFYYMLIVDSIAFVTAYPAPFFSNSQFINSVLSDPSVFSYDTIFINSPDIITIDSATITNPSSNFFSDGSISIDSISGGTAPYSYLWSPSGQTTQTAINLSVGGYLVDVTDLNGCFASFTYVLTFSSSYGCTDSLALNYDSLATIDDGSCIYAGCLGNLTLTFDTVAACNNALNASLTALPNGTAPYTYLWSTGATTATINNLSSLTSYTVSIIDNNGCIIDSTVFTPESAIVNLHIDFVNSELIVNCYGDPSSGIEVIASGGTSPYTYSIDGGMTFQNTGVYVGLFAGIYSVYTFDDNGCSDSTNVIITEPSELSSFVILIDTLISCNGGSNGAVSVAGTIGGANPLGGTTPYTFNWSNGSTSEYAINLSAGSYTLDITDDNGCTVNEVFILTEPSPLQTTANIINPSSISSNDGSIELFVSGGTSPYSYLWSSGQTTSIIINLINGSYSCIISDSNSCIFSWTGSLSFNSNSGCTDSLAFNYDSLATIDDSSCVYYSCQEPAPTSLFSSDITDTKATVNWDNMNSSDCMVFKYIIRYREFGTNNWTTKSGGVGNGLCNFGVNNTFKVLRNLSSSTTYQYKMKAFYCNGGSSTWTLLNSFTTSGDCPEMINLTAQTFPANTGKVTFSWDSTGAYVFARVALRVNNSGSSWQTAGGFGVYYPTLSVNKFGLLSGTDYRAQGRTFCDSNITSYRSWWTPPMFWTQPTIRLGGGTSITELDIYPNPSRDVFNISFNSETLQDLSIRILNVVGAQVYKETKEQFVGEYTKQISLDDYGKGIYFLEIETKDGVINKKLILQ
jgi:hypothetical protein